ncbi:hypothetical protein D3C87_1278820 [compost metagenome]
MHVLVTDNIIEKVPFIAWILSVCESLLEILHSFPIQNIISTQIFVPFLLVYFRYCCCLFNLQQFSLLFYNRYLRFDVHSKSLTYFLVAASGFFYSFVKVVFHCTGKICNIFNFIMCRYRDTDSCIFYRNCRIDTKVEIKTFRIEALGKIISSSWGAHSKKKNG